jgi:hypothetical protein
MLTNSSAVRDDNRVLRAVHISRSGPRAAAHSLQPFSLSREGGPATELKGENLTPISFLSSATRGVTLHRNTEEYEP